MSCPGRGSLKTPSSGSVCLWTLSWRQLPKPLDHRHCAGLAVRDAVRTRGARVEGQQYAGVHAQHRAAQGVIPGQSVAQAIRQREHPLAHRHPRQHLVDETGGAFGHPPPPTTRTEAASLAGEGHEALEGAVGAPKPREAVGQHSTRKELAELLLDEAGQAAAAAAVRDFAEEGIARSARCRGADTWGGDAPRLWRGQPLRVRRVARDVVPGDQGPRRGGRDLNVGQ